MSNDYSRKAEHLEFVVAKANDPKVEGGKIVLLKTPGSVTGKCVYTGEELTYDPHPVYEILEVAKNEDAARAAGWYNRVHVDENGPVTKQEWVKRMSMKEDQEWVKRMSMKEDLCDSVSVGGLAVDMGQPIIKAEKKEPSSPAFCPQCHGPRKGRGHIHTDECPINRKNIVPEKKEPSSVCPGCNGPRRGRGFTHKETCSLKKKVE